MLAIPFVLGHPAIIAAVCSSISKASVTGRVYGLLASLPLAAIVIGLAALYPATYAIARIPSRWTSQRVITACI